MDLNSQCLNLGGCVVGSSPSAAKIVKKQKIPVMLDSYRPFVPSAEFASFPANVSHLVGEYLPINERFNVETAFAGVQPITLCLSQDIESKLASCWSIGFLPPHRQWEPSDVMIDKELLIQDYQECLQLLEQDDSYYCRFTIGVLVVKLSKVTNNLPTTLKDLRKTIEELKRHLSSVTHVVISIEENASCCFTLEDIFDMVTGKHQPVDHLNALTEIIDDLHTCWRKDRKLDAHNLFTFYFKNEKKRASEMYLAKLVIPLITKRNQSLFDREVAKTLSTKIMWVHDLETPHDLKYVIPKTTSRCHAIHLDAYKYQNMPQINNLSHAFSLEDNPFIERIVINSRRYGYAMKLPRPSEFFNDNTPRSALVQLTLEGDRNTFDLSQLNNGYFPHLAHLTVIHAQLKGHLDSQSVPSLKTLIINIDNLRERDFPSEENLFLKKYVQSLIDGGLAWQLAATSAMDGWSLAMYDKPIPNPNDDANEDLSQYPPLQPIIRELLLVVHCQENADEWQLKLKGNDTPLNLDVEKNHNDGLLVWAPECVQKITAVNVEMEYVSFNFMKEIPGKMPILSSLRCHCIRVQIDGIVLPNLQSLEVKGGVTGLFDGFPQLQTLTFDDSTLSSPWAVNAPKLQSLRCLCMMEAPTLQIIPEMLPHLSYLEIDLWQDIPADCPMIFVEWNNLGLSAVNHVVFGKNMIWSRGFDKWQVHKVSNLELAVDARKLPACWENTKWQCETLTINVYVDKPERLREQEITVVKMPSLLPRLKKLTVTEEKNCRGLLDSEMPELTECTVPTPESLGPNLICRALQRIRFTKIYSESDKAKCLNQATYKAIGVHPHEVYFGDSDEVNRILWDLA